MPTITTGLFFLARQRPSTDMTADGEFRLTLHVRDKQGEHRVEPWIVRWSGPAARNWWNEHGQRLVAGQPLALELTNPRVLPSSSPVIPPEIAATVVRCELAPVAPSWVRRANPESPAAAQAAP